MKQLFGTDGIRGVAGEFPLDIDTVHTIGASLARRLGQEIRRVPRILTGRDTRESGPAIEAAFHAGAVSAGATCESAGVFTTPGIAYITRAFEFDAGIVISASHNPYQDNGIKIFSPSGKKMNEATERAIEADIRAHRSDHSPIISPAVGDDARSDEFSRAYLEHLDQEANGFKTETGIVVDCANGAASALAPRLFADVSDRVMAINDQPNGRNINLDCGSLHLEHLRAKVTEVGAGIGIAFDGDADRALFIDENGEVVDGDAVLWIMARYLKDRGQLAGNKVIATVMSNIGLEIALSSEGIEMERTSVGDKYVLDRLLETGASIGGEQSGHIIFPQVSLVGDGMMTAMLVLRAITERGQTLSEAVRGFVRYPQVLLNVKVREKRPFDEVPAIVSTTEVLQSDLDGNGRLLLRYSGTENLARVMIEGKDQSTIERQARHLAGVIEEALG